jgi:hypothetical protein
MPGHAQASGLGRGCGPPSGWQYLTDLVRAAPVLRVPRPGPPGCCTVCHGPVGRKSSYCAQCRLHAECAQGGLSDVVVPIAYAVKGDRHAMRLWQYKSAALLGSGEGTAEAAAALLRALLLVFLRDHGGCVYRAAAMASPTHMAVVPTGRGRPGQHPLRALISPYLRIPWAQVMVQPRPEPNRDLDPGRFAVAPVPGARVLLVDDTWTTGASAQSAAMALRRAGARSVATVVLGRHVSRAAAEAEDGLAGMPYSPESCAVHGAK